MAARFGAGRTTKAKARLEALRRVIWELTSVLTAAAWTTRQNPLEACRPLLPGWDCATACGPCGGGDCARPSCGGGRPPMLLVPLCGLTCEETPPTARTGPQSPPL